jgi:hypothetical protein
VEAVERAELNFGCEKIRVFVRKRSERVRKAGGETYFVSGVLEKGLQRRPFPAGRHDKNS